MSIGRRVRKAQDGTHNRISVLVTSDLCEPYTEAAYLAQQELLQAVARDQNLLLCDGHPFQNLKMNHDGEKWVLEAQANLVIA
jgi:hypothetical protein